MSARSLDTYPTSVIEFGTHPVFKLKKFTDQEKGNPLAPQQPHRLAWAVFGARRYKYQCDPFRSCWVYRDIGKTREQVIEEQRVLATQASVPVEMANSGFMEA